MTDAGERGVEAVSSWLDERAVRYQLLEHSETFSAADEARAVGVPSGHAAKTLALHDSGGYRLAVIPASRRLDLGRLRELTGGSAHLRLATEEEMERDFPDFEVGALPPFGPMLPAPEVVDLRLLYHDRIVCGAGDHRHAVALDPRELLRITEPRVADVCQRGPADHDEDFSELPRL